MGFGDIASFAAGGPVGFGAKRLLLGEDGQEGMSQGDLLRAQANATPWYETAFASRPQYSGPSNADMLGGDLQAKSTLDQRGLNAFRDRALASGSSPWAAMQMQKQREEEMQMREGLAERGAGQAASARSSLAMRGGLSGGASERLAGQAMRERARGEQGISREGRMARLGIGTEDERTRMGALSQLPGMELGKAQHEGQVQQFNIQQALAERRARQEAEQAAWQQKMQAQAAERSAQAQEKAADAGGISWLCTEVRKYKDLPENEAQALDEFKKYAMNHSPKVTGFYLECFPQVIGKMNETYTNWREFYGYISATARLMEMGEKRAAYKMYRDLVCELIETHWADCPHEGFQAMKDERQADARGA